MCIVQMNAHLLSCHKTYLVAEAVAENLYRILAHIADVQNQLIDFEISGEFSWELCDDKDALEYNNK